MVTSLSCFPTERKNKDAIRLANASDREMQRDAVMKFISSSVHAWSDGIATAQEAMLVKPRLLNMIGGDVSFYHAYQCVCPIGCLFKNDVCKVHGCAGIARMINFFQEDGACKDIVAQVWYHEQRPSEGPIHYYVGGPIKQFVPVRLLGDALIYYVKENVIVAA